MCFPSLSIKKAIKITDRIPRVNEPNIDPIELSSAGIASMLFLVKPSISIKLSLRFMLNLFK